MRRSITLAASFAVAAAFGVTAIAAYAQSAQQDTAISANVPVFCTIGAAASPAALNTAIAVDPLGMVATAPIRFTVPAVVCNTSTNILATSVRGGVKSDTTSGATFTNIINYRGTARFGGARSVINTGKQQGATGPEAGNTESTSGPTSGNLTIVVRPIRTTTPLIAATDYHDTLRVTLTPD